MYKEIQLSQTNAKTRMIHISSVGEISSVGFEKSVHIVLCNLNIMLF